MISYVNSKIFIPPFKKGKVIICKYIMPSCRQLKKSTYSFLSESACKSAYGLQGCFWGNEELNNNSEMSLSFNILGNAVSASTQNLASYNVPASQSTLVNVYYLNQPALRLL